MFDLEILIPTELNKPKLAQRFKDFKKFGLINTKNTRIRIIFAASSDNLSDDLNELCSNWPDNIQAEYIITPYQQVAQRIVYYYDNVIQPDTARWYMRIDEDSMTDINGLLKNIDMLYDHKKDFHIVGDLAKEICDVEYEILKDLGFSVWYDNELTPVHDLEISITSNSAIQKILNYDLCKEYFKKRKEVCKGYGDHPLCMAAMFLKIHPIIANFVTPHPKIFQFSKFGGVYNHIHNVSRDKTSELFEWLDLTETRYNSQLDAEIISKIYLLRFIRYNDEKWLTFDQNHTITLHPDGHQQFCKEIIGIWHASIADKIIILIKENPPFILSRTKTGFQYDKLGFILKSKDELSRSYVPKLL